MGKSRREREQKELQQKRRSRRNALIFGGIVVVLLAIVATTYWQNRPAPVVALELTPDGDGNLSIATAALDDGLTYINYGGTYGLLGSLDGDGGARLAFNVCEECHYQTNVNYSLNADGATLTCDSCGTTFSLADLGTASWGGCQPVAIPADFRADTQETAVIPAEVLAFAETVFGQWTEGDYSQNLGDYSL